MQTLEKEKEEEEEGGSVMNLQSLANCASRIARTLNNRQKRISRFSDATQKPFSSSQQINIQNPQQSLASDKFQEISLSQKSRSKFSDGGCQNKEKSEQEQLGRNLRKQSEEEEEVKSEERVVNSKEKIIECIKSQLNHQPYRVIKQLFNEISQQLERREQNMANNIQEDENAQRREQEREIEQLGIVMDEKDLGSVDRFNTVFIRHALSEVNYYSEKHKDILTNRKEKQHFRYTLFQHNNNFLDSDLHKYGIIQCQIKSSKLAAIPFTTIFVSPMARAIQSCIHLFKDHPLKASILFYVHSNLGEMLKKDSDIFDSQKFITLVDEAESLGIKFNTTKYFSLNWQEKIVCQQYQLKNVNIDPLFMKEILYQVFPLPLESFNNFKSRSLEALKNIQNSESIENNNNNNKIGIISHSLVQLKMFEQLGIDIPHEVGNLQLYYHQL